MNRITRTTARFVCFVMLAGVCAVAPAAADKFWLWECDVDPTTLDSNGDGTNDWVVRSGASFPMDSLITDGGLSVYSGAAGGLSDWLLDTRPLHDFTETNVVVEIKWKCSNDNPVNDHTSFLWCNVDYSGDYYGKTWYWVNREGGNTVIHIVRGTLDQHVDDFSLTPITVSGTDYFTMRLEYNTTLNTCKVYINGDLRQTFTYADTQTNADRFITVGLETGKGYIDYVYVYADADAPRPINSGCIITIN